MSITDTGFTGSIPEIYDTHLVPLIFEDFATDLALRIAARAPLAVLETAAGSGVVTRALAPRLGPSARYEVTDLNQPMLDRARARQPADARIGWRTADAQALPFPDSSFDAVCNQFGVMFLPDRVLGYSEARRVLRHGGRFHFNVWDDIEANLIAALVVEAAADVFPGDPPRFLARTPHGHGHPHRIRAELAAAGFGTVAVEVLAARSRAPDPRAAAVGYVMGTPLRSEIEARDPDGLRRVLEAATARIARACGDGPVDAPIRGFVIEAVA